MKSWFFKSAQLQPPPRPVKIQRSGITEWNATETYKRNDLVLLNGEYYSCNLESLSGVNPLHSPYWKRISTDFSKMHQGAWNKSKPYSKNDLVSTDNDSKLYISLKNKNIDPPLNTESWRLFLSAPQVNYLKPETREISANTEPVGSEQKIATEDDDEDDIEDDNDNQTQWDYLFSLYKRQLEEQNLRNHVWKFLFKSSVLHHQSGSAKVFNISKDDTFITIKFDLDIWSKPTPPLSSSEEKKDASDTSSKKGATTKRSGKDVSTGPIDAGGSFVVYLPLTPENGYISEPSCDFIPKNDKLKNVVSATRVYQVQDLNSDTTRLEFKLDLYLNNTKISLVSVIRQLKPETLHIDFVNQTAIDENAVEANSYLHYINVLFSHENVLIV